MAKKRRKGDTVTLSLNKNGTMTIRARGGKNLMKLLMSPAETNAKKEDGNDQEKTA